jgi:hypothetical protein
MNTELYPHMTPIAADRKTAKEKGTEWAEEPFHVFTLSRSYISFKLCNLRMSFTRIDLTSGINEANSTQGA